jgi:hypothetical protein
MILLLAVFFGFYFHPLYRAAGVFGEEECGGCAIIYNVVCEVSLSLCLSHSVFGGEK